MKKLLFTISDFPLLWLEQLVFNVLLPNKRVERILFRKSELFVSLPDYCPTPDGMAMLPMEIWFWHVPILQISHSLLAWCVLLRMEPFQNGWMCLYWRKPDGLLRWDLPSMKRATCSLVTIRLERCRESKEQRSCTSSEVWKWPAEGNHYGSIRHGASQWYPYP